MIITKDEKKELTEAENLLGFTLAEFVEVCQHCNRTALENRNLLIVDNGFDADEHKALCIITHKAERILNKTE